MGNDENNTQILVRYAEIALKGANRYLFENQLQENIKRSLRQARVRVEHHQPHLVVNVQPDQLDFALNRLGRVFGIAWYAPAVRCGRSLDEIVQASLEIARGALNPNQCFAVRGQRADKSIPYTSVDIEVRVGDAIRKETGALVNLDEPDVVIFVHVSFEGAYIHNNKFSGPGGLPVGPFGKVLALLSGGGDSIAAAYSLAKRGAQVNFLHFHALPNKEQVLASKISRIVADLSIATYSDTLYLASFLPFQM